MKNKICGIVINSYLYSDLLHLLYTVTVYMLAKEPAETWRHWPSS